MIQLKNKEYIRNKIKEQLIEYVEKMNYPWKYKYKFKGIARNEIIKEQIDRIILKKLYFK